MEFIIHEAVGLQSDVADTTVSLCLSGFFDGVVGTMVIFHTKKYIWNFDQNNKILRNNMRII